ncbi:MAG: hypothetical protein RLZZ246_255, partial [Planctomycetota bacterium]
PCVQCSLAIIQAGLAEVVTFAVDHGNEPWSESIRKAIDLFAESGVSYRAFPAR